MESNLQVEFENEKCRVVFLMLPEGAVDVELIKDSDEFGEWCHLEFNILNDDEDSGFQGEYNGLEIELPIADWQLLGNAFELREENWVKIVELQTKFAGYDFYRNYEPYASRDYRDIVENSFIKASESGRSLLRHLKIYKVNPLGKKPIWKPKTKNYGEYQQDDWVFNEKVEAWNEAESRTSKNWVAVVEFKK